MSNTSLPGTTAPSFTLPGVLSLTVQNLSLTYYTTGLGKWVLLVFYPNDFTTICPYELLRFNDEATTFSGLDVQVILISGDSPYVHLAYQTNSPDGIGTISYPMVSDADHELSVQYNAYNSSTKTALRTTVLIDPSNVIRWFCNHPANVDRDISAILTAIANVQSAASSGSYCTAWP
jgi:peroxiredoxin (alkyl hydroperoxide reductase subunit C)